MFLYYMSFISELPEGIEQCDYSLPERRQYGINYPEIEREVHGHIITGIPDGDKTAFCMNTDLQKNEENIATVTSILNGKLEVPVYLILCHGAYSLNVSMIKNESGETHYYSGENTKYQLTNAQFVVNTTPFGSLAMMGSRNVTAMIDMFNPETVTKMTRTLLSDRFLETFVFKNTYERTGSSVVETRKDAQSDIPIDEIAENSMFCPPLYDTINKRFNFKNTRKHFINMGIYQLNKNYDGIIPGMTGDAVIKNIFSEKPEDVLLNETMPGVYVDNQESEREFVELLNASGREVSESDVLRIFGPGIYIVQNCSPIMFKLKNENTGKTMNFDKATDYESIVANDAEWRTYISIAKSLVNELEAISYNLNYRWFEMVQGIELSPEYLYTTPERGMIYEYYKKHMINDHFENVDDYIGAMNYDDSSLINFRAILKRISILDRYSYFNYILNPLNKMLHGINPFTGGNKKKNRRSRTAKKRKSTHKKRKSSHKKRKSAHKTR